MNYPATGDLHADDVHQRLRTIAGRQILVDKEGFLWHWEDWTDELAETLAAECGLEPLSDLQWRVIRFMRQYFGYHGRAPLNRDLKAGLGMSLAELVSVFPGGISRQARLLAGLPNPRACTG